MEVASETTCECKLCGKTVKSSKKSRNHMTHFKTCFEKAKGTGVLNEDEQAEEADIDSAAAQTL
jgi:hypothetical protein